MCTRSCGEICGDGNSDGSLSCGETDASAGGGRGRGGRWAGVHAGAQELAPSWTSWNAPQKPTDRITYSGASTAKGDRAAPSLERARKAIQQQNEEEAHRLFSNLDPKEKGRLSVVDLWEAVQEYGENIQRDWSLDAIKECARLPSGMEAKTIRDALAA